VKTIKTSAPEHRCDLPGRPWNQHWEPVGTVVECGECHQRWRSEAWPLVRAAQQTVGNHWVRVRTPIRWPWQRKATS
jgi:hypothetical protein